MNEKQLELIHMRLGRILGRLRDNPYEESNPELFKFVKEVIEHTDFELSELGKINGVRLQDMETISKSQD